MRGAPPADLAPEDLFATLIAAPRPSTPLREPPSWAHGLDLYVRAISAREDAAVRARVAQEPPHARERAIVDSIIIAALWTPTGPALRSPPDLDGLEVQEAADLARAVFEGLDRIAPTYARSDGKTWSLALQAGARHPQNLQTAISLALCVDMTAWGSALPRPDRFFGMPIGDMTDGQWMAFRAARTVLEEISKK
jgi:hypothetical protein